MTDVKKTRRPRRLARNPKSNPATKQKQTATQKRGQQSSAVSPCAMDKPQTKTAMVLGLLQRPNGATLYEMVAATGWLPHTTRAALTGLRKKGHAIAKTKREDVTCYRIAAEA